jgi:Zinc-binding dehydrogenase
VAGCRLAGAERIVAVDLSEERLEHARAQGATETLPGGPDVVERILEKTDGFGADYTFEATGLVGVMRQAVESARLGWGLCTIAGVAGKGEVLEVVPRYLITGRRIAGASFGGAKGRDRVPRRLEPLALGVARAVDLLRHQPRSARCRRSSATSAFWCSAAISSLSGSRPAEIRSTARSGSISPANRSSSTCTSSLTSWSSAAL